MFVLDRSTNKLRIAVRSLDGTVANQGTEVSVAAAAPFGSANSIFLGANLGLDAIERAKFSSMYVAYGSGAATGMSANAATILLSFANKLNNWPYTLPSYGQGYEDVQDKYATSVNGLRDQLMTEVNGVVGDVGNQSGMTIYLLNETSGNLVPSVGSPTLTASGSPLYGIIGPRNGRDRAIGFSTTADAFSGGTGDFDVNGSADIMIVWVGRITSAPANGDVIGKGNAGAARWYLWHGVGGFAFNVNDGVDNLEPVTSSLAVGEWHVGIAALERATNQARIGIRTLAGVSNISSAADASAIGSLSNAVAVKFGKSIGNADTFANYAGLAITTGTNVAKGVVTNMSAILLRYATALNRYYGAPLLAAME
jgi:hypothetical protein